MGMSSEDYVASGYGHKVEHQYPMDRRHYGDRQNAFMGRDDSSVANLQSQVHIFSPFIISYFGLALIMFCIED